MSQQEGRSDEAAEMAAHPQAEQQHPPTPSASADSGSSARSWLICLLFGLLAVVASWGLVVRYGTFFDRLIPEKLASLDMMSATEEEARQQLAAINTAKQRNTALVVGLVGMTTGGLLALALGFARKSLGQAVWGTLAGVVLGAVTGAAGGWAEFTLDRQLTETTRLEAVVRTIVDHGLAWGLVGLGVGVAISLIRPKKCSLQRSILAPVAAGVIGGVLYTPLALVFLPLARPETVYPSGAGNQLLWIGLPVVLMAIAVARVGRPRMTNDERGIHR